MRYEAFISYSSKDKSVAERAVAALESAGVKCWVAPRDITPGMEWAEAIIAGINACRVMVLVFSESANDSPQIKRELERAVNRRMPVVPFKIDAAAPSGSMEYFIMAAHWLDASRPPVDCHFGELVRSAKALLAARAGKPADAEAATADAEAATAAAPPAAAGGNPLGKRLTIAGAAAGVLVLVALAVGGLRGWGGRGSDGQSANIGGTPPAAAPPTAPAVIAPPAPARPHPEPQPVPTVAAVVPVHVPDRLKGLSAGAILGMVYESDPPPAAAASPPPRVQVGILARRAGQTMFAGLKDGDTLSSEIDDYLLAAKAMSPGWLYIFQVDSAGKVDWLFPKNDTSAYSAGSNPVAAGQTAQVPATAAGRTLFLDRTTGVEHVYFVFCAARWPELEKALSVPPPPVPAARATPVAVTALRGAPGQQAAPPAATGAVTEWSGMGTRGVPRGVGGTKALAVRPDVELTLSQAGQPVKAFGATQAEATGPLLVVERWFRHVE